MFNKKIILITAVGSLLLFVSAIGVLVYGNVTNAERIQNLGGVLFVFSIFFLVGFPLFLGKKLKKYGEVKYGEIVDSQGLTEVKFYSLSDEQKYQIFDATFFPSVHGLDTRDRKVASLLVKNPEDFDALFCQTLASTVLEDEQSSLAVVRYPVAYVTTFKVSKDFKYFHLVSKQNNLQLSQANSNTMLNNELAKNWYVPPSMEVPDFVNESIFINALKLMNVSSFGDIIFRGKYVSIVEPVSNYSPLMMEDDIQRHVQTGEQLQKLITTAVR